MPKRTPRDGIGPNWASPVGAQDGPAAHSSSIHGRPWNHGPAARPRVGPRSAPTIVGPTKVHKRTEPNNTVRATERSCRPLKYKCCHFALVAEVEFRMLRAFVDPAPGAEPPPRRSHAGVSSAPPSMPPVFVRVFDACRGAALPRGGAGSRGPEVPVFRRGACRMPLAQGVVAWAKFGKAWCSPWPATWIVLRLRRVVGACPLYLSKTPSRPHRGWGVPVPC